MTTWSSLTWTTARAGGITAYVLLSLSVLLGLALSMRWQRPNWPRLITNELHEFVTLLTLVFIAVHSSAILLDPYIKFSLQDVLVPLASTYRTLWLSMGIVGTYLALAVWISTQFRAQIGFAIWRKLHFATFIVYVFATLHGLGTGSDTRAPWALAIYGISVLGVGALLAARLMLPTKKSPDGHPMIAGLSVFGLILGTLWTLIGPLQPGWAAANNGGAGAQVSSTGQPVVSTNQNPPAPLQQPATGGGNNGPWGRDHGRDGGGSADDNRFGQGSGDDGGAN